MADSSPLNLEALTEHVDAIDIPFGAERTRRIVSTLSKTAVKAILNGTNWAQKGGASKPTDFARRQIVNQAAKNPKRSKYLANVWISDHVDLLTYMQEHVNPDSLRDDLATLFQEHDATPEEISLALRFDSRASVRGAADELSSKLLDETSPLRAQYTVQQLRQENETLRSKKNEQDAKIGELESTISDLRSTQKKLRSTQKELQHETERLEQKLADRNDEIQTVREELQTARSTAKTRKKERDSARDEVESLTSDLRLTRQKLDAIREKRDAILEAIDSALDRDEAPEPGQVETAIQSALDEVRQKNESLRQDLERLRAERNQLAPALDQIDKAWNDALTSLSERVADELETLQDDTPVDPGSDWESWMADEQSLITSLFASMDDASEQRLHEAAQLQASLRLRWYLLEWIKLGLRRTLNASSVATQPFDSLS